MKKSTMILRMDDLGAASKRHEVYSKWRLRIAGYPVVSGNWLFLKYTAPFKAWARYREMESSDIMALLRILERWQVSMTIAVTACWVEDDGSLTPYPQKFPRAAETLRSAACEGIVEIANHGLTHCIVEGKAFRPRWFHENRPYHREFTPLLNLSDHESHLKRSQAILQDWLGLPVTTFVPPGNMFLPETVRLAKNLGIHAISCKTTTRKESGVDIIGNEQTFAFHDREMVLFGGGWLEERLNHNVQYLSVKEWRKQHAGIEAS